MTAAFDAILFDADGVLQDTDEKWFYAMTALIGTDDEEQVERSSATSCRRSLPRSPANGGSRVH